MTEAARVVTPLRFVAGVIGLWTATRLAILLPQTPPPVLESVAEADAYVIPAPGAKGPEPTAAQPGKQAVGGVPSPPIRTASATPRSQAAETSVPASAAAGATVGFAAAGATQASAALSPSGLIPPPSPPPAGESRWSGNLYLFRRGAGGPVAIASGGQLGGSQAGARIAYRLDVAGRVAAAARISSPLEDQRGAEAALGLDWHPLTTAPMRVSVERRLDLGGGGRNAWSAYAAGGVWRQVGHVVLDGYGQAGVVGARRRDLFADGALRAGYRHQTSVGRSLTIGAGAWAAAQPGVKRIDVGPRAALGLNVGATPFTVAAEWRVRIAGDAAPGSGLALTIAADF